MERGEANKERLEYRDDDILIYDSIRELPPDDFFKFMFVNFIFCVEGEARFLFNSHQMRIQRNQIMITSVNDVISDYECSPDFEVKIVKMSSEFMSGILHINKKTVDYFSTIHENPIFSLADADVENIKHYFCIIARKIEGESLFIHDVLRALLQAMTFEILDIVNLSTERNERIQYGGSDYTVNIYFNRFIAKVVTRHGHTCTVKEIADELNISPKYLSACVKKACGRNAQDFIRDSTTQAVRQKLKYSDHTIKEISVELGFPSLSFFGTFCRKNLGMSPSNYRKMSMAGD